MKPSFALDLRDEQVVLLHRTSRGWQEVGRTRFDAPDMAEALAYMRSTALGLSPRGISTKLIIPNDQILYTQLAAPGPDAAKRKKQVRAALDGLTPYALDDLVFDIHGTGPEVQVAAVAKETLEQAEGFAAEHRFNPVSFVAVPDNGLYLSEPFFGPSKMSPALLSEGEKVDRDSEPVLVIPRELPRAPVEPEPEPVAEAPAAPEPAPEPVEAKVEPVAPEPVPEAAPEPIPEPAPAPEPFAAAPAPAPKPAPEPELAPEAPIALDVALDLGDDDIPPAPTRAEPARPVTAADLKKTLAPVAPPAKPPEEEVQLGPSEAVRAVLAARRAAATGAAPELGAAPAPAGRAAPAAKPAPKAEPSRTPPPLQVVKTPAAKPTKGGEAMVTSPGIPGLGRRKSSSTATLAAVPASPAPATAETKAAAGAKPMTDLKGRPVQARGRPRYLGLILTGILLVLLALVAAWSSLTLAGLGGKETPAATTEVASVEAPQDAASSVAAAATSAADEAAADGQDLAAAAPAADAGADPVADPAAESPTAAAPEAATDTAATEAATAETAAPSADVATSDTATAEAAAPEAATTEAAADAASAETTTPEPAPALAEGTAVSAEAVTGATAGAGEADQVVLAGPETPTTVKAPGTLQAAAAGDAQPLPSPDPPPYGTVYQFDAEGRIVPTKEGIISPEGVLLVAGAPQTTPPDRPAAIAALAPAVTAVAAAVADPASTTAPAATGTETAPDTEATPAAAATATPQAAATTDSANPGAIPLGVTAPETAPADAEPLLEPNPEMQEFRPKSRPEGLVPATATETPEEPPPAADPRLAGFKPKARETSPVLVAMAASTAGLDAEPEAASELAVASSALPPARPAALAQGVQTAVAAAVATEPAPAAQPAAAAPAATTEGNVGDEPEVTTPIPKIPTSANVAKVATEKNAVPVGKLALIGIFGADGTRYAYVRLANGTFKKVKVGDQLDGGTVVAISAGDLRYQKGGREVVLAMPREG